MPRQKAAPPPTAPPLEGCAIALSGKFDSFSHSHASLEQVVRSLGGTVTRSVTKATTHVVCTEDDFNANSSKVTAGVAKGLPLISPEWIFESDKQKMTIDADDHAWTKAQPNDSQSSSGKKRPIIVAKRNDESDEEPPKKTRKANGAKAAAPKAATKTAKAVKAKAKAKAKAKVESDDEEEAEADDTVDTKQESPAPAPAKEEKEVAEGQFIKKKDIAIPVDDHCPLTTYQVHIDPDNGLIYDASLNQTNASNNANKFYRIQVLVELRTKSYKTWTRWGRVGESGQNAILGNGTLPDAIKNFEKKFRDKSGLLWDNRGDNPKPGKYAFVEKSYNPDSDDEDEDDAKAVKKEEEDAEESYKPPECTLQPSVKSLMELIFNQQFFQATMSALNYDANKLPLGKLSKATIKRGFQQLKDLAELMDSPTLANSKYNTSVSTATENLSNMYYSVIPHAFGRNRPPVINNDAMLKKEIELLESLSDMKDADEIMKINRKTTDSIHPLDRQFQSLGLDEMTVLDRDSSEFGYLNKYLQGSVGDTHHVAYQIDDIFRIERHGEKARFEEYAKDSKIGLNRRLLWHGSRCTNFGGILSQGLRIAPPEAPVSGYMFGKGIYLADMSSKSAGYCCSSNSNGQALLLLCEAKLGDPIQELTNANYNAGEDALKAGMESTFGMGRTAPSKWMDAGVVNENLKGIQMPDVTSKPGPTNIPNAGLYYNEYICYDIAQVRLRYLLRVKM